MSLAVAEFAIYSALTASDALESLPIRTGMAGEGGTRPCIVITLASSADVSCQTTRISSQYIYSIEAFRDGESFPHELADAIDVALQNVTVTTLTHTVIFERIRAIEMADHIAGKELRRSGGMYRATVRTV